MDAGEQTVLNLMLLETPGIGAKTLAAVLRRNAVARRTPDQFLGLSAESLAEEYGIRRAVAARLAVEIRRRREESELQARWLARNGISLVTLLDATYPVRLAERLEEPPPVLFLYGKSEMLRARLFAVANSNGAPEAALAAADSATECAVESGWTLITGHNRPAYQRPALAARRNGAPVIYVLDRGLLHGFGGDLTRALFPAARIWGPSFDPLCDLAISPFPLRAQGMAASNRRRDSVIFALADRIFAVHLKPGGQMERECLAALSRNQRVLVSRATTTDSIQPLPGAETADLPDPPTVERFFAS